MLPAQIRQELDLRVLPDPDHQRGHHRRQDVMDRHPGPPAPTVGSPPPSPRHPEPTSPSSRPKPENRGRDSYPAGDKYAFSGQNTPKNG